MLIGVETNQRSVGGAVAVVLAALPDAVRDGAQLGRCTQGDAERVGLVGRVVLDGPPQVGTLDLAAHGYPRTAVGGLGPGEPTVPRRTRRDARRPSVRHAQPQSLPRLRRPAKVHAKPVALSRERTRQRHLVVRPYEIAHFFDARDGEGRVEVEHHRRRRLDDARLGDDHALDGPVVDVDGDLEVDVRHVNGGLLGEQWKARVVGEGLRRDRRGGDDTERRGQGASESWERGNGLETYGLPSRGDTPATAATSRLRLLLPRRPCALSCYSPCPSSFFACDSADDDAGGAACAAAGLTATGSLTATAGGESFRAACVSGQMSGSALALAGLTNIDGSAGASQRQINLDGDREYAWRVCHRWRRRHRDLRGH